MAEARKKLEVNTMEDLSINKEVYDIERENVLSQAQAATQAGMEGDSRGAAATAGRVQMATQAGQRQVRAAQEQELNRIQELVAKEDSRLRDLGVQMDLQEVAGAQQKAADMEKQRAAAVQQGFQSAGAAAQQGLAMIPLFSKNIGAQQKAFGELEFTDDQLTELGSFDGLGATPEGAASNFNSKTVADLSRRDFKAFKKGLTTDQYNQTIGSQQFQDSFERYKPKEMSNAFGMQYGAASMDPEYLKFLQYQQMMAGKTE